MDTHFWLSLACGILWIAGVWTAFKPEMIFGFAADWLEWFLKSFLSKGATDYVMKPITKCPPCMASLHGSYVWFICGGTWWGLAPYIVCLCGACSLIFIVFPSDD